MKKLALLFSSLLVLFASTSFAAKSELNLFAWSEYIPQEVIDGFSKETGITVNYETYASNEEMLSKLIAGGTAYDLVQPTDYMAELMIREKMLAPLDPAKVPLLVNIDAELKGLPYDTGLKYTVPYMTGTVGIVVNTDKVKTPITGFADVFTQAHNGRLVVLNDNRELVTWALASLGISANEVNAANLEKVRPVLKAWLPLVKVFDSDSPKTALLSGDVDIGIVWSGEAAILWNTDKKFAYVLPKEGAHRFIDVLGIPVGSKNKDAAHQFINYILRPQVSLLISEKFPYTNPNVETRKLLSAEQLANPASYPGEGKLQVFRDIGRTAADIDKLVTDLKSSQ